MKMKPGAALVGLLALGLAACSQAGTGNEADSANQSEGEVTATEPGPASAGNAAVTAPADDGVSSTMPVPGTNTPEHIVVNNDVGPNELDGL